MLKSQHEEKEATDCEDVDGDTGKVRQNLTYFVY